MRGFWIVSMLLALIGAVGCDGRRQQLVGYWEMEPIQEFQATTDGQGASEREPFVLELQRDGQFRLQMTDEPMSGRWRLEGQALTCEIEKIGDVEIGIPEGRDRPFEIVFAVGSDNKTLTEYHIIGQGGKSPGLHFTKKTT